MWAPARRVRGSELGQYKLLLRVLGDEEPDYRSPGQPPPSPECRADMRAAAPAILVAALRRGSKSVFDLGTNLEKISVPRGWWYDSRADPPMSWAEQVAELRAHVECLRRVLAALDENPADGGPSYLARMRDELDPDGTAYPTDDPDFAGKTMTVYDGMCALIRMSALWACERLSEGPNPEDRLTRDEVADMYDAALGLPPNADLDSLRW